MKFLNNEEWEVERKLDQLAEIRIKESRPSFRLSYPMIDDTKEAILARIQEENVKTSRQ